MQPVVNTNHSHTLVHFSSVLVAVVCIGPIVTYKLGAAPQLPETPCPTGLHSIYVRNGATLHLVADTAVTHVPFVRFSDFMPHWQDLQNNLVEIVPDVDFFKVGTVLMSTLDLKNGQMVWLVAESLPPSSNTIKVCGQLATKESLKKYGFFHVHSMQELNK